MGRTTCIMCGASLHESHELKSKPESKSSIGSIIGVILGILAFQAIAPYIFESSDSINYIRVAAAAIFGGAGAFIGKRLEKLIREKSG